MTLPALPSPSAISPADVDAYAVAVERFADKCDDIAAVTDTKNKWAAITEYIRRSSRAGVNRAEVAMRHLEQRVGLLIVAKRQSGELASNGGDRSTFEGSKVPDLGIESFDASEFVAMAEHPEIVEAVIAVSSDAAPATRNKVRSAIREHKQRQVEAQAEIELDEMLDARGIRRLTDPAEIAAMQRRCEVLAMYHGSIREVLEVRDTYDLAELLSYSDDRLWDLMTSDALAVVEFIHTVIAQAKEAAA